jgi:hypothetical protein
MHCSREMNSGACQLFFSAFMIASPGTSTEIGSIRNRL